VPAEFTVMSGRRLMATVQNVLHDQLKYSVIAGLSNSYSGYVTTKEEYDMQYYEGASTHFGPWTLAAYQQTFHQLAVSLQSDKQKILKKLTPIPFPEVEPKMRNLEGKTMSFQTGVMFDSAPLFKKIGDIVLKADNNYQKGETVTVKFWSGHPKNNLKIQSTFLTIERKVGDEWSVVATDNDWETKYEWTRINSFLGTSQVTITWEIPKNQPSGTYRIKHYGDKKVLFKGIYPYTGVSNSFRI